MSKREMMIKSTILISSIVLLSKVFGFLREAVIAGYYGMTQETDAYFFAYSMPAMLFPAVCTSVSTVFLPLYIEKLHNNDKLEADKYGSNVLSVSICLAILLSIIAVVFAPIIVKILAPGFDESTQQMSIFFTRIVMSAFPFLMVQYILTAIMNAQKKFGVPQMSGLVLNIIIIISVVVLANKIGIIALIMGLVVGYVGVVIYLIIFIRKRFKYKVTIHIDNDIKHLMIVTGPVLVGNAVLQLNTIVDKLLSSLLDTGAVSALSYGNTLSMFIYTIIISAIATVYYPFVSDFIVERKNNELKKMISKIIMCLLIILIPISIITCICAEDIVSIVYGRGSFGDDAVLLTAEALRFYSVGFIFTGIREILARTFYAAGKTTIVMKNGMISIACNIVISIIFSRIIGIGGIAMGTSVASLIASMLLLFATKKHFNICKIISKKKEILKIFIATIPLVITALLIINYAVNWGSFARFGVIVLTGCTMYLAILFFLKSEDLILIKNWVMKRIRNKGGKTRGQTI